MNDIAILNLTRFGDLIQTTPILKGLRKRHPEARIHLVVKSRFRSAAEMLPVVNTIHEIDGDAVSTVLSQPDIPFIERFRSIRHMIDPLCKIHFDQVINFTHSRASAVLLSLLDADRCTGFIIDREGHRQVGNPWLGFMGTLIRARRLCHFNLVEIYRGSVGMLEGAEPVQVRVLEAARALANQRLPGKEKRIAIQLGASQDSKTWSIACFAQTLRALAGRLPDTVFVPVGVRKEAKAAQALIEACPEVHFENLVGETSLDELAAVLERCDLLLTGDTGTMHLSAAVGTPTCAIFVGLGMPYETAAYAADHFVLKSRISCSPCSHEVHCGNPVCHSDIPSDWLADLLERIVSGKPVEEIAPLPRADLLRTRFEKDGRFELIPVPPRPPDPQDLLALAYREVFLGTLDSNPIRPERVLRQARERFGIGADEWLSLLPESVGEGLRGLESWSRAGQETAGQIHDLARTPRRLAEAAKRLQQIDETLYAIARSEPLLTPLGLALEGSLEDLPEGDLPSLANICRQHYATLEIRARTLREIITPRALQTFAEKEPRHDPT